MKKFIRLGQSEEDSHLTELIKIKEIYNKNSLLTNIKSKYNLKSIFSYLKYNYLLKLIKYNKSIQNKIGIRLQNYKDYSDIKYITEEREYESKSGKMYNHVQHNISLMFLSCFLCVFLAINIFYIIYVIIVQTKLNIIFANIANISLFCLILLDINFCRRIADTTHVYSVLFFTLIHVLYEILIAIKFRKIYKLYNTYTIDIFFLIINLIFIIFSFCIISYNWPKKKREKNHYLIRYKNISINNYFIKDINNFNKNPKEYIINNREGLNYHCLEQDLKILKKINILRQKNNLNNLEINLNLPDFIINEKSEVFIFNINDIFKISNNKYILKYELGKFEYELENNNKKLIKILLKKDLKINIFTQGNIQYIRIFEYI